MADSLAFQNKEMYPNTPHVFLQWNHRKRLLLGELIESQADIICLQEVDDFRFFQRELQSLGYVGKFKKRTGEQEDGCAIFWKQNNYNEVECKYIEFKKDEWLDRDNVAIICLLQPKEEKDSTPICVANTHLLFNPRRGDIKLGQLKTLLDEICSIKHSKSPIILCGDLNLTPHSAIYHFLASGSLNLFEVDQKTASGQQGYPRGTPLDMRAMKQLGNSNFEISHELELESAYSISGNEIEQVSTFHQEWVGAVDFIWYSKNHLSPSKILSLPSKQQVLNGILGKGLPNKTIPSDHLPLITEFIHKE